MSEQTDPNIGEDAFEAVELGLRMDRFRVIADALRDPRMRTLIRDMQESQRSADAGYMREVIGVHADLPRKAARPRYEVKDVIELIEQYGKTLQECFASETPESAIGLDLVSFMEIQEDPDRS